MRYGKSLTLHSRLWEEKCKPMLTGAAAQPPSFATDQHGLPHFAGMPCIYDCVVTEEDLASLVGLELIFSTVRIEISSVLSCLGMWLPTPKQAVSVKHC